MDHFADLSNIKFQQIISEKVEDTDLEALGELFRSDRHQWLAGASRWARLFPTSC